MADSAEAAQAGRAAYASYRASADLRFAAPGLGVSVQLRLRPAEIALFWLSGILACVIMTALAQLGLIRYRSDQNRRGWTAGLSSRERPLPAGADGLPRRSDFWLATLLAVAAFLILLYAGTRSHHLRHGAASRPTPAAGHQ